MLEEEVGRLLLRFLKTPETHCTQPRGCTPFQYLNFGEAPLCFELNFGDRRHTPELTGLEAQALAQIAGFLHRGNALPVSGDSPETYR